MTSQIDQSTWWRINSSISPCRQLLIYRTRERARQRQADEPSQCMNHFPGSLKLFRYEIRVLPSEAAV
jgi:hypothetical protein